MGMLLQPDEEDLREATEEVEPEVISEPAVPHGIGDVLAMCGISNPQDAENNDTSGHLQSTLKRNNASVEHAAKSLGTLLVAADSDAVKLNAAKMILQLHGHLTNDPDDGKGKGPVFNITIVGKQQQNILNVLIPSQT
jgi:hypothetical protein